MSKVKYRELTASEITKDALLLLSAKSFTCWRQNQIPVRGRAFTGKKGLSDIIGFDTCGKFVLCEVKKNGDTLKEHQIEFLNQASSAGCHCFIARQVEDRTELIKYEP